LEMEELWGIIAIFDALGNILTFLFF
jgi:hypothetical protein